MPADALRLGSASDALGAILPFAQPADAVLRGFFREHPELGQRDRGAIAELTFAVIRNLRLLETIAAGREPRRLLLAAALLTGSRSIRQLEPMLGRGEADWLAQARAIDSAALALPVQLSLPDWVWERLLTRMPEQEAVDLGRALLAPAPLDLRVNPMRAQREDVFARLHKEGVAADITPYSPFGLRLRDKLALQQHPLFLDGTVEVQDEASQLLALLVGAKRREMVVDFCAGAGGKTLALGAMMRSEGRLYAFDTAQRRLNNLTPRLKRSGLSNVHPQLIDSERDRRIQRLHGKIDRVLVDAPCSGLGTLRRNPDLKWRQSPRAVEELCIKQSNILAAAAQLVKPGGRLVYATCSILTEENDAVVERFLAQDNAFAVEDAQAILQAQGVNIDCGRYFTVLPHLHRMDGFFAAVLTRHRST